MTGRPGRIRGSQQGVGRGLGLGGSEWGQGIELFRGKIGGRVEVGQRLPMTHEEDAHRALGHGPEFGRSRRGREQGEEQARSEHAGF